MESIMAAFRTEAADLERLADEVDAADGLWGGMGNEL
jgi:hypothetical protein